MKQNVRDPKHVALPTIGLIIVPNDDNFDILCVGSSSLNLKADVYKTDDHASGLVKYANNLFSEMEVLITGKNLVETYIRARAFDSPIDVWYTNGDSDNPETYYACGVYDHFDNKNYKNSNEYAEARKPKPKGVFWLDA